MAFLTESFMRNAERIFTAAAGTAQSPKCTPEKALVSRLAGSKIEYAKALFRKDAIQNVVQKHSSGGILLKSRIVSYDLIRKDLILGRAVRERNRGVAVKGDVAAKPVEARQVEQFAAERICLRQTGLQ